MVLSVTLQGLLRQEDGAVCDLPALHAQEQIQYAQHTERDFGVGHLPAKRAQQQILHAQQDGRVKYSPAVGLGGCPDE